VKTLAIIGAVVFALVGGCTACVAVTGHNSGSSNNSSSKSTSPIVAAPSATSPQVSASGPVNEQYFLGDIRGETPSAYDGPWVPWPDDQTLMSQGHEVCTVLSAHGGDSAAVEASPPTDMRQYEEDQLHSLIDDATEDLCFEYSADRLLGHPPSQRLHPQKTMPPTASIGQAVDGETLVFTVNHVSTAKTVQDADEVKTAKGIYVVVTTTVKNNTGAAQQLEGSSQVLRDSAGWQFSAGGKDNENASTVVQKGGGGVDIVEPVANLDPDQQMTVGVMFDVPEGTQPSQIVLKEMRPGNTPPLNNPYGMVVNLS
jgi:hypothetical protein